MPRSNFLDSRIMPLTMSNDPPIVIYPGLIDQDEQPEPLAIVGRRQGYRGAHPERRKYAPQQRLGHDIAHALWQLGQVQPGTGPRHAVNAQMRVTVEDRMREETAHTGEQSGIFDRGHQLGESRRRP